MAKNPQQVPLRAATYSRVSTQMQVDDGSNQESQEAWRTRYLEASDLTSNQDTD